MMSYVVNWDELEPLLNELFGGLLLRDKSDIVGEPKVVGRTAEVPALHGEFLAGSWTMAKPSILQGITYGQSGWKSGDIWTLRVNGEQIFEVYTKEQAERKSFSSIMPVYYGDKIEVLHHNKSGNSKQVWVDLEYLEIGGR